MPTSGQIVTGIAIYFILWWVCIFMVLPHGIKGQHEADAVVEGSEPGAPVKPHLRRKIIQTSLFAAIIWAIGYVLYSKGIVTLDSFDFLPDFVPKDI